MRSAVCLFVYIKHTLQLQAITGLAAIVFDWRLFRIVLDARNPNGHASEVSSPCKRGIRGASMARRYPPEVVKCLSLVRPLLSLVRVTEMLLSGVALH